MAPYNAVPLESDSHAIIHRMEKIIAYQNIDVTTVADELKSYAPEMFALIHFSLDFVC